MPSIKFHERMNPYKDEPDNLKARYYELKSYISKAFKYFTLSSTIAPMVGGVALATKGLHEGDIEETRQGCFLLIGSAFGIFSGIPIKLVEYFAEQEYYSKIFSKVYKGEIEWSWWQEGFDGEGKSTGLKPVRQF